MNKQYTYDPEDLESLLRHKSFNELYPEERDFVLKHLDGEDEYNSMRTLLETLESAPEEHASIRGGHKSEVMEAFRKEKRRPTFSLNQFFAFLWPADRDFYRRPAFALGVVVMLIAGFILVDPFSPNNADGLLAEHIEKEAQQEVETEPETAGKEEADIEREASQGDAPNDVTDLNNQPEVRKDAKRAEAESIEDNIIAEEIEVGDLQEVSSEEVEEMASVDQLTAPASESSDKLTQTTSVVMDADQYTTNSIETTDESINALSSPEVLSSKSVQIQEITRFQGNDRGVAKTAELIKKREQKQLMELMYSCY